MNPWASTPVRVLAVLAAICFVLAFAMGIMLPPGFTLAHLLARLSRGFLPGAETFVMGNISEWAWRSLAMPMLARPCWLLPLDFALIFGGVAGSLALTRRASRPERRRG